MRDLNELTRYKKWHPAGGWGDKDGGCYMIHDPVLMVLLIIVLVIIWSN